MILCFRLFNDSEQGTVDIFRGATESADNWELVYTWQPRFCDDATYAFQPVCVISLQKNDNCLLITWIHRVFTEYHEGIGSLYLEYNLQSGDISEFWVD